MNVSIVITVIRILTAITMCAAIGSIAIHILVDHMQPMG